MNTSILSYDVGGSHVSAAVVDTASFDPGAVKSIDIDSALAAGEILNSLATLGRAVMDRPTRPAISGIAMSMPGPFDYRRGICLIRGLAKYEQLYGVDFRSAMADSFPEIAAGAVRFINDATAALLGEIHAGAARGRERVIGLTLGTGIGSAFAVGGRIVTSGPGVPPEGYIYNLPWKDGTIEDALSSRGIRKEYKRLTGEDPDVHEIALRATHDPATARFMEQFGRTLGEVLLPLVESFRPEAVVLGGAIARSARLFMPAAADVLRGKSVDLKPSSLGGCAGLIGAAAAWLLG